MLYKNKSLFKITPLFLILTSIMIITGYKKEFLTLILIVFFHEMAHVSMAYFLGVKIEKIFLTFLGQKVILKEFDYIDTKKKFLIILAGPLLNLILYFIFNLTLDNKYLFLKEINMAILLFNILPIYPLDGGRFIKIYLGNNIGIINSNNLINKISKIFSYFIIFLGIIQVTLYQLNISLICLGIYLNKINKKEHENINYNIYKFLTIKDKKVYNNKILKVKFFLLNKDTYVKNILNKLTWDKYYIIYFFGEDKKLYTINETEIIDLYFNKGIKAKITDILI